MRDCVENTDVEIWRKIPGDGYCPVIHATESGAISIDVGGHVIVMSVEKWHALGRLRIVLEELLKSEL